MIWFTLALFLVSFVITALLAPKPEFENARADELDPNNFPMASEDSPIPLVLGRVRLNAPNTLWYGDFESKAITEKVKTGLFSSKKVTVGYKYYLGLDMGLALGPGVVLREVYIDETLVWSGDTTGGTETVINISDSELFGGYKSGGGWGSTGKFYSGAFTQNVDTYVEGQVGSGNVPAYNGMAHMVFEHAYIGESASLRKMAFVLECYTNSLDLPDSGTINDGVDMNPAEAIYQIMVDTWRGLGIAVSDIDLVALQTVGQVLWEEQNGVSILVTSESDGARLISEILRQIDGIMYQDPDSGKVTISLIRDDYDVDLIPEFDENDIAIVRSFTRTSWDEVQSQVKVSFPQRDSESEAVAISQDMAVVATLGKLRTTTLSFPFCYDPDTANEIASRERAQRSVPLFRATIEVNRNANTLRPGSPFKFSWADYGIVDLVMRVQRFDLGELTKGKIVIEALQDKFALSDVVFSSPQSSGWTPVSLTPSDVITARLVQMPRFFTNKLETPITYERVGLLGVAAKPSGVSTTYSINVQLPGETLDETSDDPKDVIYQGSGLLSVAYSKSAGFVTGKDTTIGMSLGSVVGTFESAVTSDVINGYENIILVNNEFMAFETAVDGGSGNWTLTNVYRGLFGSPIEDHSIGARVYSVPTAAFNSGAIDIFPDGQTYNHRFLDGAGSVRQSPDQVTPIAYVGAATYHNNKPLRPGNLKLGGVRQYDPIITAAVATALTWAPRDHRVLPIPTEVDAAQTPPNAESYKIDVYVGGVKNTTLSGTVAAGVTTYNIPFNLTTINNTDVEIRVTATDTVLAQDSPYYSIYPIDLSQFFLRGSLDYFDTWDASPIGDFVSVYSLVRRISTYNGPAIRIRDTNDNSEQDVYFNTQGNLNSYTVVGEARVVTWYDQGPAGLNLTQATAGLQPRLDFTGSPNGLRPAINFTGFGKYLDGPSFSNGAPNAHLFNRPLIFGCHSRNGTGLQYIWTIPHQIGALTSPYYRHGILQLSSTTFETRWNGTAYSYGGNGTGLQTWTVDPLSDTAVINKYTNEVDRGNNSDSSNLSAPNTTKWRLGANMAGAESFDGKFYEAIICSGSPDPRAKALWGTEQRRAYSDAQADFDPTFATYVKGLFGWNGANGATSYTEESPSAAVATFTSPAALTTATKKFGSAALNLTGANTAKVDFPDNANFEFGAYDKTIRFWYKRNGAGGANGQMLLSKWLTTGNQRSWAFVLNSTGSGNDLTFQYSTNGTAVTYKGVEVPNDAHNDTSWHEVALCLKNSTNTYTLMFDGIPLLNWTDSGRPFNGTAKLTFGNYDGGGTADWFNGIMDEARITDYLSLTGAQYIPRRQEFPRS